MLEETEDHATVAAAAAAAAEEEEEEEEEEEALRTGNRKAVWHTSAHSVFDVDCK